MNQRRRLAALSEHMESRLVLSPTVLNQLATVQLGTIDDSSNATIVDDSAENLTGRTTSNIIGRTRGGRAPRVPVEVVETETNDVAPPVRVDALPPATEQPVVADEVVIVQVADEIHITDPNASTGRLEVEDTRPPVRVPTTNAATEQLADQNEVVIVQVVDQIHNTESVGSTGRLELHNPTPSVRVPTTDVVEDSPVVETVNVRPGVNSDIVVSDPVVVVEDQQTPVVVETRELHGHTPAVELQSDRGESAPVIAVTVRPAETTVVPDVPGTRPTVAAPSVEEIVPVEEVRPANGGTNVDAAGDVVDEPVVRPTISVAEPTVADPIDVTPTISVNENAGRFSTDRPDVATVDTPNTLSTTARAPDIATDAIDQVTPVEPIEEPIQEPIPPKTRPDAADANVRESDATDVRNVPVPPSVTAVDTVEARPVLSQDVPSPQENPVDDVAVPQTAVEENREVAAPLQAETERIASTATENIAQPVEDAPVIQIDTRAAAIIDDVTKVTKESEATVTREIVDTDRQDAEAIVVTEEDADHQDQEEATDVVTDVKDTGESESEPGTNAVVLPSVDAGTRPEDGDQSVHQQAGRHQAIVLPQESSVETTSDEHRSASVVHTNTRFVPYVSVSSWSDDSRSIFADLLKTQTDISPQNAAPHTVFGDATRLGLMLAAINHAGRRSGSLIAFSDVADDAGNEGSFYSKERRRRRSPMGRRMPTAFDRLRRATSDLDTVEERAAIPCAAPSCDALFADAAMMTVLFHETEDSSTEDGLGNGSLFGGLILGTAAAASAAQRRKRRPDVNRAKPATPRYSGKTIVFGE